MDKTTVYRKAKALGLSFAELDLRILKLACNWKQAYMALITYKAIREALEAHGIRNQADLDAYITQTTKSPL